MDTPQHHIYRCQVLNLRGRTILGQLFKRIEIKASEDLRNTREIPRDIFVCPDKVINFDPVNLVT